MTFIPAFLPAKGETPSDWWFVFLGDRLLLKTARTDAVFLRRADLAELNERLQSKHYLGEFNGTPCYAAEIDRDARLPEGISLQELRPLLGLLGEDLFAVVGRAFQILHWDRTHRFCGRCGNPTEPKTGERARECSRCGLISHPEVSPAVIVAVTRGREILLARARRFRASFYSVLAGFVEPGETFEECVLREVREEVGVDLRNIRYFGSQPWPFPHSVMVAFTADYAGGEITPDEAEIVDAQWFNADNLPPVPGTETIARHLIEWFVGKSKHRT